MAFRTIAAHCGRTPGATVVVDKNATNMPLTPEKFAQPLQAYVITLYL